MADNIIQMVTTDLSFHDGVLVPAGMIVNVNTDKVDLRPGDPNDRRDPGNFPNLAPVGDAPVLRAVAVAPIGPTGPSPTMPQQVPPGAFQTPAGYVVPGGNLMVAEGSVAAAEAAAAPEEEAPIRRQPAEATGDATTAAITPRPLDDKVLQPGLTDAEREELNALRADAAARAQASSAEANAAADTINGANAADVLGEGFNADGIIDGTIPEVTPRLATLNRAQLLAVQAAEADREQPRTGVKAAIDDALAKLDAPGE